MLHLKGTPAREVGLVAIRQTFPLAKAPFFWINLKKDSGQVVLLPTDSALPKDAIPSDWLASDYLRTRKTNRELSYIALNPRRNLEQLKNDGTKWVADSGYLEDRNQRARTFWVVDPATKSLQVTTFMVHKGKDENEAGAILSALEKQVW